MNETTDRRTFTLEELCRECDVSPSIAIRVLENLKRRGLIEEIGFQHEQSHD